jgi:hypothetical protein
MVSAQTCLKCPLPDCDESDSRCPLRRKYDKAYFHEYGQREYVKEKARIRSRKANKTEARRTYMREYMRARRASKKKETNEYKRWYYRTHGGREYARDYYQKNRDKINRQKRERRRAKKAQKT